jgi:hypothetical protein
MGRLPDCVRELLEPNYCIDASGALTAWSFDEITGVGSGWQGPYIQVLPERDKDGDGKPDIRFRDGYGNSNASNASDAQYSGWTFSLASGEINLRSEGFDLNLVTDDIDNQKLVVINDYRSYLQYWDSIQVQFQNTSTGNISIPANRLRLKLSYPSDGLINAWPATLADRNNSDYLSATFPSQALVVPSASEAGLVAVLTTHAITVPAGSSLAATNLTFTLNGNILFHDGVVAILSTDTVTVPAGSSLVGTSLTIGVDGNMSFPAGSKVTLDSGLQFPELITPVMGSYSLIIACDDTVNETAVSGQRFDGDCTRYGTDAIPLAYTTLNQPYLFKAVPRNGVITPPNPLIWTIQ